MSRRQHFTAVFLTLLLVPSFCPLFRDAFRALVFFFFLFDIWLHFPIYKTLTRNLELASTKITCENELYPMVFRKKGNSEAWWNGSLPAPVGQGVANVSLQTLPAPSRGGREPTRPPCRVLLYHQVSLSNCLVLKQVLKNHIHSYKHFLFDSWNKTKNNANDIPPMDTQGTWT